MHYVSSTQISYSNGTAVMHTTMVKPTWTWLEGNDIKERKTSLQESTTCSFVDQHGCTHVTGGRGILIAMHTVKTSWHPTGLQLLLWRHLPYSLWVIPVKERSTTIFLWAWRTLCCVFHKFSHTKRVKMKLYVLFLAFSNWHEVASSCKDVSQMHSKYLGLKLPSYESKYPFPILTKTGTLLVGAFLGLQKP